MNKSKGVHINENKRIEKQQNILYAMGVHENEGNSVAFVEDSKVAGEFSKYIKTQLVITDGLNIIEDNDAYLIDIKKEQTKAKAGESRTQKMRRKSFKARHGKNIAKGKMSAAYWANKVKW